MTMTSENDDIDFGKLEIELENAIAKDEKYQRENDAKFRAVHQKVASYDEFRDIVLASHLKPLDRKDISGGMKYQAWNTLASAKSQSPSDIDVTETVNSFKMPKTSAEFDKVWKHTCKSPAQKFDLLGKIGSDKLKDLFKTECPLGEIISVIKSAASFPKDCDIVLEIFDVMSNTKRFLLSLDFLDKNERNDLNEILAELKVNIDNNENSKKYDYVSVKYNSR
uniref:coiled-coil domain-containing protein 103-like n=1 Tax=Styela clava TaxID=7725 RepID=UPI00193948EB|nr:coiled-coil domain-containing protein 103-like [Styela clava]